MGVKLLIACLSLVVFAVQVQSYIQEYIVYTSVQDEDGNFRNSTTTFRGPVRNISEHFLAYNRSQVHQVCYRGYWNLYADGNFSDWDGKDQAQDLTCSTYKPYFVGLRSGGARETNIDAISIYNAEFYVGDEHYTEGPALGGLAGISFILTGRGSWTLFNGSNFEGPTYCQHQGNMQGLYDWGEVAWGAGSNGLTQIGSVLKGCFAKEELQKQVQLYRK